MSFRHLALLLAAGLAAGANAQQTLVCPTAPSGGVCEAYHYHVAMYRPDTKQFVEMSGVNQFATQAACERAREIQVAANAKAVDYLRSIKQQYEADRAGPCHCDMTGDRSAPNFLPDAQRTSQVRLVEEIRLRLRERLLDHKLTSDSAIVRDLWSDPPGTPILGGPKFVPVAQPSAAVVLTATEDLRATTTIDSSKPIVAALDLPLVDLNEPVVAEAAPAPDASGGSPAPAAEAQPEAAAVSVPPEPAVEEVVVPVETAPQPTADAHIDSTVPEEDSLSAEETAERFISYETQRIQNVLRAAGAIADENVKSRIFEACMQRIQLLSNLRLLIEGSGMRSRLAAAARDARQEPERLLLIGRLFGDEVKPHWAPRDATDVILDFEPEIAAAPERALRDTTGRMTLQQKKRALYLVLAQTQPTEDQRLWLSSVVEGFLR
jgi:hypothetical protein